MPLDVISFKSILKTVFPHPSLEEYFRNQRNYLEVDDLLLHSQVVHLISSLKSLHLLIV